MHQEAQLAEHPTASVTTAVAWGMARFVGYAIVSAAVGVALARAIDSDQRGRYFAEAGAVEWFQFGGTAGSAGLFLLAAARSQACRDLLWILGALAAIAACREFDTGFDRLLPWVGWQGPAAILAALAVVMAWRVRTRLAAQIVVWCGGPPFALVWAGFIVAVCFAQLLGMSDHWRSALGDNHRPIKRVVEESMESIGYWLVLVGACETLVRSWRRQPSGNAVSPGRGGLLARLAQMRAKRVIA